MEVAECGWRALAALRQHSRERSLDRRDHSPTAPAATSAPVLEPGCGTLQRSPAHRPSRGVASARAVVGPGREGEFAFGTRESKGSKAEALAAGRGIELGDFTDRTLRRKNAGLHIRGGGQVVDVELDPTDEEAPTG